MTITEEIITPDAAQYYLEGNSTNRPLSPRHVEYLCSEIRSGRWRTNGETIKFNGDRLLDGQHRLHAVIKSGQPIASLVVRDLEDESFHTIDTGKRRSAADTLNIMGEKQAHRLASAIALIDAMEHGQTRVSNASSGGKTIELLKKHPEVRDSLVAYQGPKTMLKPSVAVALHYFFAKRDRELADRFFHDLRTGSGLVEGDPVFALREKLIASSVGNSRLLDEVVMACTIKAWNALRRGQQVKRLYFRPSSETFPEIV